MRSSWVRVFGPSPTRIGGRREGGQHVVVEEVGERSMPDVVQQAGDPERLDDQALGRQRSSAVEPEPELADVARALRRLG